MARKLKTPDDENREPVNTAPVIGPETPAENGEPSAGQIPLMTVQETPAGENPEPGTGPVVRRRRSRKPKPEETPAPEQTGPDPQVVELAGACAQAINGAWVAVTASYPREIAEPIQAVSLQMVPQRQAVLIAPVQYAATQLGPEGQLIIAVVALAGMELALYAQLRTLANQWAALRRDAVPETRVGD